MAFYTGFVNRDDKAHGPGVKTIRTIQLQDGNGPNNDGTLNVDYELYAGQHKDGKMHGHGYSVHPNRYDGEWSCGKKHGKVTFTWTNGATLVGMYKFDKPVGKHVYTPKNGTTFFL